MASPWERAFRAAYHRRLFGHALDRTRRFERHYGLVLSSVVGVSAVFIQGLEGTIAVGPAVRSVLLAFLAVGVAAFLCYLVTGPWELALKEEVSARDDPEREPIETMTAHHGYGVEEPTRVEFVTRKMRNRLVARGATVTAVRFVRPRERLLKPQDLPDDVPLGWWGRLTVKAFTGQGILIDESRSGVMVELEVYVESEGGS